MQQPRRPLVFARRELRRDIAAAGSGPERRELSAQLQALRAYWGRAEHLSKAADPVGCFEYSSGMDGKMRAEVARLCPSVPT